MSGVDDIRTEIVARLEHAQKCVASAELHLRTTYVQAGEIEAELRSHDRAVAAMLEARPAAVAAPVAGPVKQKDPIRAPRLTGPPADERRQEVVAAYKRGISTRKLAKRHQVSVVRILQILQEHEEKTGEKIERHWQQRARRRTAEAGGSKISVDDSALLVSRP